MIALRLAKAGFYGGNPEVIMAAPADMVISMLEYETFEADYEAEYIALNKES